MRFTNARSSVGRYPRPRPTVTLLSNSLASVRLRSRDRYYNSTSAFASISFLTVTIPSQFLKDNNLTSSSLKTFKRKDLRFKNDLKHIFQRAQSAEIMSDLILTAVTAAPGRDEEERVARRCHVVRTRGNMVSCENPSNGRSLFQMDH